MLRYAIIASSLVFVIPVNAQNKTAWIRPDNIMDPPIWGIQNGIVVALWPASVEPARKENDGGPRGLLRIGYNFQGTTYLINFIAVEPLVNDKMEFSEISPSKVDGKWGKFMWASDTTESGPFAPGARTRGRIVHPDAAHPEVEELQWYVFMEPFLDGAKPYLQLGIRSDRPGELKMRVFDEKGSTAMQRCALTATMGNYSRLRKLYLKDSVIHAVDLYRGFTGIDFTEREGYPAGRMLRGSDGSYIAAAETDEPFSSLANWPQQPAYLSRPGWRYRPFYSLTQYWRAPADTDSTSLQVRVNGRARYWAGGTTDTTKYIRIPGGVAFENFELRQKYKPGQTFYFGLTQKSAATIVAEIGKK